MKLYTALTIFIIFLLSLGTVLAESYVIDHNDEIDQINEMRERHLGRGYDSELAQLRHDVEQLRQEHEDLTSNQLESDYYDRLDNRRRNRYCDREDTDDLDDLLDDLEDDEDIDEDDLRELRRLQRRCDYGNDYDDNFYYSSRYCDYDPLDYADNYRYDNYLYDVHRLGRCRRAHVLQDAYDDYYDNFDDRWFTHDTSYDPYTDVLHELDDRDFFTYGPGSYNSWGQWCNGNRYIDGSLPDWCYERMDFIDNVDWD